MDREPDVEAEFTLLTPEQGGRTTPVSSGYRPNHLVKPGYLTSGTHHYVSTEEIPPGGTALGSITFITPEAYPHCLAVGQVVLVQEGGRLVGEAKITRILNPLLAKGS